MLPFIISLMWLKDDKYVFEVGGKWEILLLYWGKALSKTYKNLLLLYFVRIHVAVVCTDKIGSGDILCHIVEY